MENLDDPFAKQITISLCKKIICSFLTDSPITLLEILILGKTHMYTQIAIGQTPPPHSTGHSWAGLSWALWDGPI